MTYRLVKGSTNAASTRMRELLEIIVETYALAHDLENPDEDGQDAANERYCDAWLEMAVVMSQVYHDGARDDVLDNVVDGDCSAIWTDGQVELMQALFALKDDVTLDDQRRDPLAQLARTVGGATA